MSPDLFNYDSEMILQELEVEKGLKVGGQNITNLRYADDIILLAKSEEDLQKLLDVVVRESELKGLSINCKKTEEGYSKVQSESERPDNQAGLCF